MPTLEEFNSHLEEALVDIGRGDVQTCVQHVLLDSCVVAVNSNGVVLIMYISLSKAEFFCHIYLKTTFKKILKAALFY